LVDDIGAKISGLLLRIEDRFQNKSGDVLHPCISDGSSPADFA